MEGLGKIPFVNGWIVFSASIVLLFFLDTFSSGFNNFIVSVAALIPAPFQGSVVFVLLFFSGILTAILKILDAPKPKLGSGQRFASLEQQVAQRPGVRNPAAVAASIGRNKYGPQRFAQLSAQGKRRKN